MKKIKFLRGIFPVHAYMPDQWQAKEMQSFGATNIDLALTVLGMMHG